jgi:methyl-accepting chemotaxis protein
MKVIGNMKVGMRLGLGFAALLTLQLVTTGIGMRQMADLSSNVTTITEVGEAKLKALNEISANIGARAIAARNLALLTEPAAFFLRPRGFAIVGEQRVEAAYTSPASTTSRAAHPCSSRRRRRHCSHSPTSGRPFGPSRVVISRGASEGRRRRSSRQARRAGARRGR